MSEVPCGRDRPGNRDQDQGAAPQPVGPLESEGGSEGGRLPKHKQNSLFVFVCFRWHLVFTWAITGLKVLLQPGFCLSVPSFSLRPPPDLYWGASGSHLDWYWLQKLTSKNINIQNFLQEYILICTFLLILCNVFDLLSKNWMYFKRSDASCG